MIGSHVKDHDSRNFRQYLILLFGCGDIAPFHGDQRQTNPGNSGAEAADGRREDGIGPGFGCRQPVVIPSDSSCHRQPNGVSSSTKSAGWIILQLLDPRLPSVQVAGLVVDNHKVGKQ